LEHFTLLLHYMCYCYVLVGWYCTSNSSSATPSAPEGGECQAGFYCPEGSDSPLQCTPGTYCQTTGLATPTNNCTAGKIVIVVTCMPN
jgi:hypothetical protein